MLTGKFTLNDTFSAVQGQGKCIFESGLISLSLTLSLSKQGRVGQGREQASRAGVVWCVTWVGTFSAVCAAALGCLSCASDGFCLSVRVVGSWGEPGDLNPGGELQLTRSFWVG